VVPCTPSEHHHRHNNSLAVAQQLAAAGGRNGEDDLRGLLLGMISALGAGGHNLWRSGRRHLAGATSHGSRAVTDWDMGCGSDGVEANVGKGENGAENH
jgi:hypothetical protein